MAENNELQGTAAQGTGEDQVVATLQRSASAAEKNWPQINTSVTKAMAALSAITVIETAEQDEYAKNLLVKVSNTYKNVNALRMEITGPLDEIKSKFMEPEKRISTDPAAKNSEYIRVKMLRDAFAQKEAKRIADEKAKIDHDLKCNNELSRVRGALQTAVDTGVLSAVQASQGALVTYWNTITLDSFAAAEQRFANKPALKPEVYNGMFNVAYDSSLVAEAAYTGLVTECKSRNTYEVVNAQFVEKLQPIINEWAGKLPQRKAELEQAKAEKDEADRKENEARLERERKEKEAQQEKDEQLRLQKEKEAEEARAEEQRLADEKKQLEAKQEEERLEKERQAQAQAQTSSEALEAEKVEKVETNQAAVLNEQTSNHFTAQAATQQTGELEGVRTTKVGTIECPEEELVVTMSELFYQCMIHPKYKGIVKRDKVGNLLLDATGRPVYEDWIEDLLSFYANNCPQVIQQIKVTDKVTTVQRASK